MTRTPRNTFCGRTRREFLGQVGCGFAGLPLVALLSRDGFFANDPKSNPLHPKSPHHSPRAKACIFLFMYGGPSQVDTFDYKPKLYPLDGKTIDIQTKGRGGTKGQGRVVGPKWTFSQYGQCGKHVSTLFPHLAQHVDKLAFVHSMYAESPLHGSAMLMMNSGSLLSGSPCLGSWVNYGLGSENENLPAFVVLTPSWSSKANAQALFTRMWSSGFLPTRHTGVALRAKGDPVLFIKNPPGVDRDGRRQMLDSLNKLNEMNYQRLGDPETQTRIAQYEMAFRMQSSVPELADLSGEPEETLKLYGPEVTTPGTFAASCLLARRMMERGVRFVQIFHRDWDQHFKIASDLPNQCRDVDHGTFGLIEDLRRRGLLDDTLVVWCGEFGRTVYCQGALTREDYGRDHHPRCFTMWAAGGGIRPGVVYGETDDFSYNVVRDPVHIRDLNATVLHCLGIDHERLSVKHQGLDVRLTSVEPARVVTEILA